MSGNVIWRTERGITAASTPSGVADGRKIRKGGGIAKIETKVNRSQGKKLPNQVVHGRDENQWYAPEKIVALKPRAPKILFRFGSQKYFRTSVNQSKHINAKNIQGI
jgi:hypothetical protein